MPSVHDVSDGAHPQQIFCGNLLQSPTWAFVSAEIEARHCSFALHDAL